MRFAVLGPVEVTEAGRRVALGGRRHLEVLSLLLLHQDQSVSLDWLVTELWGESADRRSTASLYTHVSNLRRGLGGQRIVRDANGYRLELLAGDDVDAQRFEALTTAARQLTGTDPATAATRFADALRLWRGRAYEGLEDVATLEPEIARLGELRAEVEVDRFEALLRSGGTPAVGELEELCGRRPYDESAWALLMRTLYRAGRQADALAAYRRARELFGEELGIDPSPSLARLEEQILLQDPALEPALPEVPSNLPRYLTTFVGRSRERAELMGALASHRLVTVTGPGGAGKTRLAVEAAREVGGRFHDGVWLVDLGPTVDAAGVGGAVAAAIRAPGGAAGSLGSGAAALRGRRSLVLLDNCEHVRSDAASAARRLLDASPGVAVLATSRIPLGIVGEHMLMLGGLPVDDGQETTATAVALFADRARSRSSHAVEGADAAAVRTICARLDGLPLALELAAAQTDVRTPTEIAELLARRFAVLVDQRQDRDIHRSLEATIGWSYGLLEREPRAAFAALGVFEGAFTLDAACAVLPEAAPDEQGDRLERLVRASLVTVETGADGVTTYRLLDTLRAYARERLAESETWDSAAERHDRFYLAACRELADQLLIRERPAALRWIANAVDELRAAWDRMQAGNPAAVLPIGWALGNHWLAHGGIEEGERRIRELLARTAGDASDWRMFVLAIGAWLADRRGDAATALSWSDEALDLAEAGGDPLAIVVALNHGGQLRVDRGDQQDAVELLHRSLAELEHAERREASPNGVADGRAWANLSLAEAMRWSGQGDATVRDQLYDARRHFVETGDAEGQVRAGRVLVTMPELPIAERERLAAEMLSLASARGDEHLRYEAARATATVSWESGNRERAAAANRTAIRTAMGSGSLTDLGSGLLHAGTFSALMDEPERAARLIGAGERFCGTAPGPYQPIALEAAVGLARERLGAELYDELYRIGAAMTPEEAARVALRSAAA